MNEPKLLSASIEINIACDDGYDSSEVIKSGAVKSGVIITPQSVLLEAFTEITRLTALFGLGKETIDRFNSMREAVAKDKAKLVAA